MDNQNQINRLRDGCDEAVRLYHEAAALANAGQFNEAVARASAIEQTGFQLWWAFRNEALVGIVSNCAESGEIDHALEISSMIDPHYRSAALHWIALACHRFGQHERALQVAESITDDYLRTLVLSRVSPSDA